MLAFGRFWCNGSNGTFQMFRQRNIYIYIIYIIRLGQRSLENGMDWNQRVNMINTPKSSTRRWDRSRKTRLFQASRALRGQHLECHDSPHDWQDPIFGVCFSGGTRCPILGPKLGQSSAHWAGGRSGKFGRSSWQSNPNWGSKASQFVVSFNMSKVKQEEALIWFDDTVWINEHQWNNWK